MRKIVSLFIICFLAVAGFAQDRESQFPIYAKYISEVFNITWKKPKGFIDLRMNTIWSQGGTKGIGNIGKVMLQSKDENSLIMYPDMNLLMFDSRKGFRELQYGDPNLAREQMMDDMKGALDIEDHTTMLIGGEAPFNADTVFIAQIPLKKPYREKYL